MVTDSGYICKRISFLQKTLTPTPSPSTPLVFMYEVSYLTQFSAVFLQPTDMSVMNNWWLIEDVFGKKFDFHSTSKWFSYNVLSLCTYWQEGYVPCGIGGGEQGEKEREKS